ncbi:MAG TPA: luciferase family protein [Miltoncostaeaceae bacterium]|nr:luciferase family protein [Miltoncostaeaceae bacterium]
MSTTTTTGAAARITREVTAWPGVEAGPGSRGEFGFRVGRREIGHLHGDRVAHFGFPRRVWEELMAQGRITRHPIDHDGWGARAIHDEHDEREVIALMRLNYDRAAARLGTPDAA